MFTKATFALIGAFIAASPALAQNSFQGSGYVPQRSDFAPAPAGKTARRLPPVKPGWNSEAGNAFGQAAPSRSMAAPREHVVVDGIDQGTDPDPLVRLQLLRDPPHGG
jgi:hypothetical protein